MAMRVLLLGGGGMLARAIVSEWGARGAEVRALDRRSADVTSATRLMAAAREARPDWIVNCAALTRVDDCEAQPAAAMQVNDEAVGHAAAAAADVGARLLQVSTDYVFDGAASRPYREDDATGPLSVYGRSKLAGERRARENRAARALVVRVSWLFGEGGPNFARTIARQVEERRGAGRRDPLRVVADQTGCPTHTGSVARALWDLVAAGSEGVVHYRDREPVSWHGFARRVVAELGSDLEVEAISSAEMQRPARRPAYSVLDVERFEAITGRRVELWSEGLKHYLQSLRYEETVRT
jgi:dTDP-4-dehydrorhamnose reductase